MKGGMESKAWGDDTYGELGGVWHLESFHQSDDTFACSTVAAGKTDAGVLSLKTMSEKQKLT